MLTEKVKIRIIHVLPNLSPAGAELVVFNLLKNLNVNKYDLALLLFKDNGEGSDWQKILMQKGVVIKKLSKKYLFDPVNFWQIIKFMKKFKADIVHTHLGGDIYGRIAAKILRVKIIASTEHNINVNERRVVKLLKQLSVKFVTKIFAVSQAVKKDVRKRYHIPENKIDLIYNGIDLDLFPINSTKLYQDRSISKPLVIGTLSRLTAQKGLDLLIQAASKLNYSNYLIKIAGTGELKDQLIKLIKQHNLEDKITLVGQVVAQHFLKEIDIFVFPSRWEGLGLSLLEAGAMSKVVIASKVDGIREIINQESGFLFSPEDVNDLTKTLDQVLINFNQNFIQNKAINLMKRVQNKFSLSAMVQAYDKFYQTSFHYK